MVRAEAGFWIVLALMVLLFPFRFLIGVVLAATIHELGHLIAIRLTGGRVRGIFLHGGGARIESGPMEPGHGIVCALAGPGAGALTVLAWRWVPELAAAGLIQTIFNLIPVYPLDGGQVARNICCKLRHLGVQ